jgi:murein endopeptidase
MRLLCVAAALFVATTASAKPRHHDVAKQASKATKAIKRLHKHLKHRPLAHGPIHGQSYGAPWDGELHDAAELPEGDGYVIRRPYRAFGTRATVDYVSRAITDFRAQFPDAHVLAIGDISAKDGGQITEHHSHQSGRDVDIGLVYKTQPEGFPKSFVTATDDNLDAEATYALLSEFADTEKLDGGVQVIFLDYNVQGILVRWAQEHGEDAEMLARMFQYPHRGASGALVRHEPNHDNHMHVRFRCPKNDTACSN